MLQLYPEPKVELQKENQIKFSGLGIDMLITRASKDQFQVRAFQENNPKHTNIDRLTSLKDSDFF